MATAPSLTDAINRVQFIAEDFETFVSEAQQFYQDNYPADFNNVIATDLGNALVDQLAFAMQSLAFMVNRRASELFLATAVLNSSVVKLARMLGYPIAPASPASTTLNIVFPNAPYSFPIPIPTGFQFQGPGSIIYEYIGTFPAVLEVGQTSISIPIVEGQTVLRSFISDGTANQDFQLVGIPDAQNLYSNGFLVTVDGTAWALLSLLKFEATNTYEVLFVDNPPDLRFGDGILGNIPPADSEIAVSFRYGMGLSGAIGQNQISAPVTPLVVNGQTITMSFTNLVSNVGSDPETIEHVKAFASSFFRTQNAAVIKSDYDTIANLQPGVAVADAEIIRGIANDLTLQALFTELSGAAVDIMSAALSIAAAGVTGLAALGVSGIGGLFVGGVSGLGVSGTDDLGVSGIQYLGVSGSGILTGTNFLGVSGINGIVPIGQDGLFIGGTDGLGVSGIEDIGIEGQMAALADAAAAVSGITSGLAGLESYLSQNLSDTSIANVVQVTVLGVDANNNYIAPSPTVIAGVSGALEPLKDASVTLSVVDGSPLIVYADMNIEIGINQQAVELDVITVSYNALMQSIAPLGLLIRRAVGMNLYLWDIEQAIGAANAAGDLRYVNIQIINPVGLLDQYGNLLISKYQVIQGRNINIQVVQRFIGSDQLVTMPT